MSELHGSEEREKENARGEKIQVEGERTRRVSPELSFALTYIKRKAGASEARERERKRGLPNHDHDRTAQRSDDKVVRAIEVARTEYS